MPARLLAVLVILAVSTPAAAQDGTEARLRTQAFPTVVPADEPFGAHYEWEHLGDDPWTGETGYVVLPVHEEDGPVWSLETVDLRSGEEVLPGDRKIWAFTPRAPKTPGTYRFHWQLTLDGEPIGDIPEEGQIEVVARDPEVDYDPVFFRRHRGNFLVQERRPLHVETEDGQAMFLLGKSAFGLLSQRGPVGFLEEAKEQGFNMVKVHLLTPEIVHDERFVGTFDRSETGWPWLQDAERWNLDTPNNRFWNRLDTLVDHADRQGMVVQLTLFTAEALTYFEEPTVFDDTKKAYVTAVIERLGEREDKDTGNVYRSRRGQAFFEVADEYDRPADGPGPYPHDGIPPEFVEEVANFIREEEARVTQVAIEEIKRLVTISRATSAEPAFADAPWNGLLNLHLPKVPGWETALRDQILAMRELGKPLVDDRSVGAGELLAEGERDDDPLKHRVRAWAVAMAGAYLTFHTDLGIAAIKGERSGIEAIRPLRIFWERLNHWEMDPGADFIQSSDAQITWGRASRTQFATYLKGLPDGGSVTVVLPQRGRGVTRYEVRWFDTLTGRFLDRQWLRAGEHELEFPAGREDVALSISTLDTNRTPGLRSLDPDCVPTDYGGSIRVLGDNFSPGIHLLVEGGGTACDLGDRRPEACDGVAPLFYSDSQAGALALSRYFGEENPDQREVYDLVEGEWVVRVRGYHGLFSGPRLLRVVDDNDKCDEDYVPDTGNPDTGGVPDTGGPGPQPDAGAPDAADIDGGTSGPGTEGTERPDQGGCDCATAGGYTATGQLGWLLLMLGWGLRRRGDGGLTRQERTRS